LLKVVTNIKIKIKNNAKRRNNGSKSSKPIKLTLNEINYAILLLNDTKEELKGEKDLQKN
jgi:hypothetical protein